MSECFLISAWYEKADTEVHFEVANEDGEQFFFSLKSALINVQLQNSGVDALAKFYYAEEDMLALAVSIVDEEMLENEQDIAISKRLFERYFNS